MRRALELWSNLEPGRRATLRERAGLEGTDDGPVARERPDGLSAASFTQEQQWYLDRIGRGEAAYLVPFALRLRGPLDVPALRAAVDGVTRRHDVLRARFRDDGGTVRQECTDTLPELVVIDVEPGPVTARATGIATEPFDLERGPLLRTVLLRSDEHDATLVWVAHHAVADGASVGVLLDELAAGYAAARDGGPEPAAPPLQYADVADWQRERLTDERAERHLAFWREHLGAAPPMGVPPDRARPAAQTFRGAAVPLTVPPAVVAGVAELAARTGATPSAVLLAALHTTLARFGGEADGVLGVAVADRDTDATGALVAPLATTVPVRIDATGAESSDELVGRVSTALLDGLGQRGLPFGELVRRLGRPRSPGRNPVYDVLFSMDALDGNSTRQAGDLEISAQGLPNGTARLDLQLTVEPGDGPDGWTGRLDYATDLYDEPTARSVVDVFGTVLDGMVAAPATPPADLPSVTGRRAADQVERWCRPLSGPIDDVPTALEAFADRVRMDPNRVAVTDGTDRLTYAELDVRSNRVARALRGRGAGPGTTVAVAVERGVVMPVAILGVWKAGATYLPLEPAYPAARTAFMLDDSGAGVLLHNPDVFAAPDGPDAPAALDVDGAEVRGAAATPPPPIGAGDAYVMYTSGSTGRPKGVVVGHAPLANFLSAMAGLGLVRRDDVVLAPTNLTFDISMDEVVLPLTVGATVVVATRAQARDGRALRDLVRERGVTVLHGTPSTFRLLVEAGWERGTVRRVLSGGEALGAEQAVELTERCDEVWNLYGPTEATVWSLAQRVATGTGLPPGLGHPLAGTAALVLDPQGRPVPTGVLGELHLAGAGLAREYRNRPELTAERFVTGPGGLRLYRTGDLATATADGGFRFHGRLDHQVKLRGHRIELGEIDSVLLRGPDVLDAVTLLTGSGTDARLVAFVRGPGTDERRLRTLLEAELPAHQVPSRIVTVEEFPVNNSGKVDRSALGAMLPPDTGPDEATEPPRTPVERWMAARWQETLRRSGIGRDDNFFTLGGHSLLVVAVLAAIEEEYGVAPALEDFFAAPTVAGLAAVVESERAAVVDESLLARIEGLSEDEITALLDAA